MNSKFILLFVTVLNLLFIGFSQQLPVANLVDNTDSLAFGIFTFTNPSNIFGTNAAPEYSAGFSGNVSGMLNPGSSVSTFSGFNFLDPIRAVLGILSFLIPIPLISFWFSMALPMFLLIIIG